MARAPHESAYIKPTMGEPAPAVSNSNLPELTVSELANAVRRTMERDFDRVRVRGELGRVLIAKSGHLYVDLKDENATISTVMWKANVSQLTFKPEEGLEVVAEGRLSTYPGRSQYQLIAERMAPAGVGALLAQLEKLKAKLQAEGVTFHYNAHIGIEMSIDELVENYDAVALSGGAEKPRDLPIPGRELDGIHFAMEFLPQQNRRVADEPLRNATPILATDKHVVVIGGGSAGLVAAYIAAAVKAWGCTGGEMEKETESSGLYEVDDAKCSDGKKYDLKLDKDFKIISITAD